jgi:hypothetical protein
MYNIKKRIQIAELKYFYSEMKNKKNRNNFFTRNPKYFAPSNNLIINWICHIVIGNSIGSKFADIYYNMTNGGALFIDIIKVIIYPFKIAFNFLFF